MKVYVQELYCCFDCPEYKTAFERCGLTNNAILKVESKRFIDPTCPLPDKSETMDDLEDIK